MTRAELSFLVTQATPMDWISFSHRLGAMADDNRDRRRFKPPRGLQCMEKKSFAAEPMEHFGSVGFHPRTLPGRE